MNSGTPRRPQTTGRKHPPRQRRFRDYVRKKRRASLYLLAADLIPARGAANLQSANLRELTSKAFRGRRTR